jgi:hypothetical protein
MKLDKFKGAHFAKGKTTYPPVLDPEARLLFLKL